MRTRTALGIFAAIGLVFFAPVLFFGNSLIIDAIDHQIIYARMADRAHWIAQGIVPLWDPKTFTGLSNVDTVPPTHVLQPQPWVMALFGDRLGYNLFALAMVVLGGFGTWLFCHRRLDIDSRWAFCAGISIAFGPFISNVYAGIFSLFPFLAFFFYHFWPVLSTHSMREVVHRGLWAAIVLALCFYSQEPRHLEHIFYSAGLLMVIGLAVPGEARQRALRNAALFAVVAAAAFILLSAPLLFPLLFDVLGQQRLGAALEVGTTKSPGLRVLANTAIGMFFPLNMTVFHDNLRLKLLGDYFTFYFDYIHILYPAVLVLAISLRRRFGPFEQAVLWLPVVVIVLNLLFYTYPALLEVWTALFKTGRFGLEASVSHFFGVVSLFLVVDRLVRFPGAVTSHRAMAAARAILTAQAVTALAAILAVIVLAILFQSHIAPSVEKVLGPGRGHLAAQLNPLYRSFGGRIPYLLLAFFALAAQIWLFRRLLAAGRFESALRERALVGFLVVTPLLLSYAYWPFNNVPDRNLLQTEDRRLLASLATLDRIGVVDNEYAFADLSPEQRSRVLRFTSNRSLKWGTQMFPPATLEFMHHFLPHDMYRYWLRMYAKDPYFPQSSMNRFYFSAVESNLFHLLGISLFFSDVDRFGPPFRQVGKYGDYHVYRDSLSVPRVYFADAVAMAEDPAAVLAMLERLTPQDLSRQAVVLRDAGDAGAPRASGAGRREVEILRYGPNTVEIRTQAEQEQFLVLTDTYDRRWKASVDNHDAIVYKTNLLFRGVQIPPGAHLVRFEYEHVPFKACIALSLAALAMVAVGLICLRGRARWKPPAANLPT